MLRLSVSLLEPIRGTVINTAECLVSCNNQPGTKHEKQVNIANTSKMYKCTKSMANQNKW